MSRSPVPCKHEDIYVPDEDRFCRGLFFFTFLVTVVVGLIFGGVNGWRGGHFWPGIAWSGGILLGISLLTSVLAAFFKKARLFLSPILLGIFFGLLISYPSLYGLCAGIKNALL